MARIGAALVEVVDRFALSMQEATVAFVRFAEEWQAAHD
jgi:hypothetical protein